MKSLLQLFKPRAKLYAAINVAAARPARIFSAINLAIDPASEWSTLKFGVYPNKTGLQVFDQEAARAIVEAFNSTASQIADAFRGLPGYVGHPDDPGWMKQNPGVRAEAVSRIREMRVTPAGLQFRTAYNVEGKRLLTGDAPAYTAYSPHWGMEPITYQGRKAFRPVELYSVGYTNLPNIRGNFIGLNEALPPETKPMIPMKEFLIKLLAALGITLAADATDDQAAAAINEALPKATSAIADQGKLAPASNEVATLKPKVTALEAQVQTAVNESATLRTTLATERTARAGLLITSAINEGRLTEAQRPEWLGKFTAQGADFASITTGLGQLAKAVNTKSQTAGLGNRRGQKVDNTRIAAINEAIEDYKRTHAGVSHDAAFNAVRTAKPELFTNDKAAA